mgnify:FL=1
MFFFWGQPKGIKGTKILSLLQHIFSNIIFDQRADIGNKLSTSRGLTEILKTSVEQSDIS